MNESVWFTELMQSKEVSGQQQYGDLLLSICNTQADLWRAILIPNNQDKVIEGAAKIAAAAAAIAERARNDLWATSQVWKQVPVEFSGGNAKCLEGAWQK